MYNHPVNKRSMAVVIEVACRKEDSGRRFVFDASSKSKPRQDLLDLIDNNGIVGLGGAAFPTSVKLKPQKKVDTLIINGCECEPFLKSDYFLMIEKTKEFLLGVELIVSLLNVSNIIIGIEDNKKKAIEAVKSIIKSDFSGLPVKVISLKTQYPQGGEKQLIYSVTKRKVPAGGLPFDVGVVVQNVATCFSVYEAVYLNKPLTERFVTFSGDALKEPKVLEIKIGTVLKDLFDDKVLEFVKEPKRVVFGGPMMGVSVDSLEYPIIKSTSGVLFFSSQRDEAERSCIRCARCVDACPLNLMPLEFVKCANANMPDRAKGFYVEDCMECGSCSYVCPAKIPIVQNIKFLKNSLLKKKRQKK
jgi:electron transport complex protein RnfC